MKRILLRWAQVLFIICMPGLAMATPIQWSGNGHYYKAYLASDAGTNLTWEEARYWASKETHTVKGQTYVGHLATITSLEEHQFIDSLGNVDSYLLGGHQSPLDNETDYKKNWNWVTDEEWKYTKWRPGEPNNDFGPNGRSEEYLQFFSAGWNDVHVGAYTDSSGNDKFYQGKGYIVEYELASSSPVPEPGSFMLLGLGLLVVAGAGRKIS